MRLFCLAKLLRNAGSAGVLRWCCGFVVVLAGLPGLLLSPVHAQASENVEELLGVDGLQALQTYCYDCHVGDGAAGGIQVDFLDSLANNDADSQRLLDKNVEVIEKIVLVLKEQQMPPADMDQPTSAERVAAITSTQ